jgi:hypothetical protein
MPDDILLAQGQGNTDVCCVEFRAVHRGQQCRSDTECSGERVDKMWGMGLDGDVGCCYGERCDCDMRVYLPPLVDCSLGRLYKSRWRIHLALDES